MSDPEGRPGDLDRLLKRSVLVESLRRESVAGEEVLRAIELVPRDRFVAPECLHLAWVDSALPIRCGQTISQPLIVAMMTEAVLRGRKRLGRVLEVGTGSGYQAAVLSHVADEVYSVERVEELLDAARERLRSLGYDSVAPRFGDGTEGWPEHAPYEGILVTAAGDGVPPALVDQLAPGARLVAPVNSAAGVQELVVLERTPSGIDRRTVSLVRFVPLLPGVERRM